MWSGARADDYGPQERMCARRDFRDLVDGMCVAFPWLTMSNFFTSLVVGGVVAVGGGEWLHDELETEIDRWAERIEDEVSAGAMTLEEAYELLQHESS